MAGTHRLSVFIFLVTLGTAASAQELLIVNATIVNPATQEAHVGDLWVRDGVIVEAQDRSKHQGATIDAQGKWVIPGLTDMHTHSYGNMAPGSTFESPGTEVIAKRLLYAGVTGFVDLFGSEEALYALRKRQRDGEFIGATLFASLSCLTATEGHCTEYGVPTRVMDSPDDARRVVADLANKKPDVIKIVFSPTGRMPSIDKGTLVAAVSEAKANGIKTVIHINTWDDVKAAVEAGASAVTHVPRGPIPPGVAELMARHQMASIPTLTVENDLTNFLFQPDVLDDTLARALTTPAIIGAYRTDEIAQRFADRRERMQQQGLETLASVKAMADAGVTILTGSDAGNWGTIQGYSAHRELVLLVAAGLTSWQALAASTTRAGAFLGRPFGVQAGDEANLVILDASPIADIRNTMQISQVIYQGKLIERSDLLSAEPSQ